jgi:hypothetical protein
MTEVAQPKKRGRPPTGKAKSPAERMREKRKRDTAKTLVPLTDGDRLELAKLQLAHCQEELTKRSKTLDEIVQQRNALLEECVALRQKNARLMDLSLHDVDALKAEVQWLTNQEEATRMQGEFVERMLRYVCFEHRLNFDKLPWTDLSLGRISVPAVANKARSDTSGTSGGLDGTD